ncbi:hypothetical protein TeGR_g9197 [Tetraparma gracilis]|uniref:C2H2-type domain-containing protein n=1 Tax=Tetraparma gracilis TaxID=2962635 RepID=A0ABQ6N9E9_9STRA|nr:hypothetical protein TeGR_g9197 [Tetraparma gracilis]
MALTADAKALRLAKTAARRLAKASRKQQLSGKRTTLLRTGEAYKVRSCRLCGVATTSAQDWELHVAGKRHKRMEREAGEAKAKPGEAKPGEPEDAGEGGAS